MLLNYSPSLSHVLSVPEGDSIAMAPSDFCYQNKSQMKIAESPKIEYMVILTRFFKSVFLGEHKSR